LLTILDLLFVVVLPTRSYDLPVYVIIHEGVDLHDEDDYVEGVEQP
jgi:hypothetical protein